MSSARLACVYPLAVATHAHLHRCVCLCASFAQSRRRSGPTSSRSRVRSRGRRGTTTSELLDIYMRPNFICDPIVSTLFSLLARRCHPNRASLKHPAVSSEPPFCSSTSPLSAIHGLRTTRATQLLLLKYPCPPFEMKSSSFVAAASHRNTPTWAIGRGVPSKSSSRRRRSC